MKRNQEFLSSHIHKLKMHNTIKYSIIPDIVSIVCVTFKEAIGLMECIEIIIRAEYGAHLMEDV